MVLMARAIAQDTPMMFLDEPTSALDFQNQMKIWETMKDIAAEGKTILACSHDPNHVSWFCDRVIVVSSRGIVADGSPEATISEEILDLIYSDTCAVRKNGDVQIVMPRSIVKKSDASVQLSNDDEEYSQCEIIETKA